MNLVNACSHTGGHTHFESCFFHRKIIVRFQALAALLVSPNSGTTPKAFMLRLPLWIKYNPKQDKD